MERKEVISKLKKHRKEIIRKFQVKDLAVFGSVGRDAASPKSDVDILVSFRNKPDFDRYMELKFYLERLLGTKVDLVTEKALRPRMRSAILKNATYVS